MKREETRRAVEVGGQGKDGELMNVPCCLYIYRLLYDYDYLAAHLSPVTGGIFVYLKSLARLWDWGYEGWMTTQTFRIGWVGGRRRDGKGYIPLLYLVYIGFRDRIEERDCSIAYHFH